MAQINHDYLQAYAPSIYTLGQAARTTSRYTPIPTITIVEQLASMGYNVTKAMQSVSRLRDRKPYAKHMLRFRHESSKPTTDSGLFPEIVLINSHDGLSSYKLMSGLFRLVCANGLVLGNTTDEVRIKHQGDILGNVIEGTYSVINSAAKMLEYSANMSQIMLTESERLELADKACAIKFADSETIEHIPSRFLQPRNFYDSKHTDLFTTFNVIQENMIKGGIRTYKLNEHGRRIGVSRTREVKSIDSNIALNKALWLLAEETAKAKAA